MTAPPTRFGRAAAVAAGLVAVGALAGCSGFDCPAACSRIYGECRAALISGGVRLNEQQCETLCKAAEGRAPDATRARLDCVERAPCDASRLDACFAAAAPGDGTPGAPCARDAQCGSGACVPITCAATGAQRRVCGASTCTTTCASGSTCVKLPGATTGRCVPNGTCGGGKRPAT